LGHGSCFIRLCGVATDEFETAATERQSESAKPRPREVSGRRAESAGPAARAAASKQQSGAGLNLWENQWVDRYFVTGAKGSEKRLTTMLDVLASFSFNVASSHSELRREENTTPVRQNKSYINHDYII
jgi:hypothetical protein